MKYGRKPRHLDVIPHLSTLLTEALPPPPDSVNWSQGMPANLGVMLNDSQGDCVEAAYGHGVQVWTYNANPPMVTLPDATIEQFYEVFGYVPGNPATDNGTDMQSAIQYLLTAGLAGNKLTAAVYINPSDTINIQRAIADTGFAFIGFQVPAFLQNLETPGAVWDLPGRSGIPNNVDPTIIGGHCVILVGYTKGGNYLVISWGLPFEMTPAFFLAYCDEGYALGSQPYWIGPKGVDPDQQSMPSLLTILAQLGSSVTAGVPRQHRHWRRRHQR